MSRLIFHTNSGSIKSSMGSGILPVAKHQNKLYFLFGEECHIALDKGWSDFGGRVEDKESMFDGAIREGYEETSGFLGNHQELNDLVRSNFIAVIQSDNFHSFLFQIKYDLNLSKYYNRNFEFVSKNLKKIIGQDGYYEKSKIRWFTLNELQDEIHLFRNFYKPFIKTIVNNYDSINKNVR